MAINTPNDAERGSFAPAVGHEDFGLEKGFADDRIRHLPHEGVEPFCPHPPPGAHRGN